MRNLCSWVPKDGKVLYSLEIVPKAQAGKMWSIKTLPGVATVNRAAELRIGAIRNERHVKKRKMERGQTYEGSAKKGRQITTVMPRSSGGEM